VTDAVSEQELLEEFRGMESSEIDHLRELCSTDNYFLGTAILNYTQLTEAAHAAFCNFLSYCDSQYRLGLVFRGYFKTTIGTVIDNIRLVLRRPDYERILIINEIEDNSIGMLSEIKNHWEQNEILRFLYPELVPGKLVGPGSWWSTKEACLNVPGRVFKEPHWTAMGLLGAAQSNHYSHIKPDDIIGEKHKESRTEMQRAIRWNAGIRGLMESLQGSRITWLGTRKTLEDVYADIQRKYGDDLAIFSREPFDENGDSIFPEKFPTKELVRIMQEEPEVWAHDYMNNPIGKGGLDWRKELINDYVVADNGDIVLLHHLTREIQRWRREELDIIVTVDPNSGQELAPDKAAVVAAGMTPSDQIIVLEARSGRPSPDGLIDWIWEFCQRWQPRCIGIEAAGQQNTIYYTNKRFEAEKWWRPIEELKHKNQDKERRIRNALDTPLKSRRLYMQSHQITLRTQIAFFPQLAIHNWDEIDALSYAPRLFHRGEKKEEREARAKIAGKVLGLRGLTGYGNSYIRRTFHRSSM
jgi:hypothetical protein